MYPFHTLQSLKDTSLPWTTVSLSTLTGNCYLYSQVIAVISTDPYITLILQQVYECQQGCEYMLKNQQINHDCEIDSVSKY